MVKTYAEAAEYKKNATRILLWIHVDKFEVKSEVIHKQSVRNWFLKPLIPHFTLLRDNQMDYSWLGLI